MNKITLVLQREYLTRVKKKSFIIMTILGPVLFAAMFVVPAWLTSMEDDEAKTVAVIDQSGLYQGLLKNAGRISYEYLPAEEEPELRRNFSESGYYAYVVISDNLLEHPNAIRLLSDAQITMDVKDYIRNSFKDYLRNEKLKSFKVDNLEEILSEVNSVGIELTTVKLGTNGDEKESSTEVVMIVSILFAFLTYMFVFVYGTQVLRGVMEEKSNRIVEVIISSIKPFQLMMGKILGIALVALTQFLLWVLLTVVILLGVKTVMFPDSQMPTRMDGMETMVTDNGVAAQGLSDNTFDFNKIKDIINSMNPFQTLFFFVLYFIGGYLLYAALFAAVGAAIDNETDSQQFVFPITIPIIIALYVAMAAFRNPHSDLVFWFSMIPLTSPVVMMARIPFEVPLWQILLSLTLLVGGFVFATWFAARIYRTGILMYGKKVDYKELWKWFRQAGK